MFRVSLPRLALQLQSVVKCADDTGIVKGAIIGAGRHSCKKSKVGHRIRVSVRDKTPNYTGTELPKGIIIRTRKELQRKDGSYIKFDENSFVPISKNKAVGKKVKGPMPYEVQHSCRNLARTKEGSMFFCPTCANICMVESGVSSMRLWCRTCPYVKNITQRYVHATPLGELPDDEDIVNESAVGSKEQWEGVATTNSERCPKCGHQTSYFKQMQMRGGDEPMTTIHRCTSCEHEWRGAE